MKLPNLTSLLLPAVLSVVIFFSMSALASLQPAPNAGIGPASKEDSSSLSKKDMEEVFDQVWKLINEKYYDPRFHGVDWARVRDIYRPQLDKAKTQTQFYSLLNRMVGELHDAHTRFETPLERTEREKEQKLTAGFELRSIDGKVAVTEVEPGSEAARKGIKLGMLVTAINGKPVDQRLAELRRLTGGSSSDRAERLRIDRRLLAGEPGALLTLDMIANGGRPLRTSVALKLEPDKPTVDSKLLSSSWLYTKISLWQPPAYNQFKKALENNPAARGIIIDLRDNPGGEAAEVLKIAALFFQDKQSFGSFVSRKGKASVLVADPHGKTAYSGPIAILVDVSSGSGSELFASVMQETHRASIIGRTSCGCLLGIEHFKKLKGGGDLAISELDYVSPSGQKVEGRGVLPDITVPLTIADLASGHDSMLAAAENKLAEIAGKTRIAAKPKPTAGTRQIANRRTQVDSTAASSSPRPHRH